ncbi:MAG: ribosome silencing factor [Paracoccaceae bacterium]
MIPARRARHGPPCQGGRSERIAPFLRLATSHPRGGAWGVERPPGTGLGTTRAYSRGRARWVPVSARRSRSHRGDAPSPLIAGAGGPTFRLRAATRPVGAGASAATHPEGSILTQTRPADASAAPRATQTARSPADRGRTDETLQAVLASLDTDKAEEVVRIDLRGRSEMGDWMVVASGRSSRQVSAIAQNLVDRLKRDHRIPARVEGKEAGDWVLIDAGDVIVHVFRPEVRDFYQLEKMWAPVEAQA